MRYLPLFTDIYVIFTVIHNPLGDIYHHVCEIYHCLQSLITIAQVFNHKLQSFMIIYLVCVNIQVHSLQTSHELL